MFTVFVVIGIITLSIIFSGRRGARQLDQARKLASALGLQCLEGRAAAERAMAAAGTADPNVALDKLPPFVRSLIDKAAGWRLEGTIEGIRVSVWTETRSSGKSSTSWTMARAYYPAPLPFDLTLARESMMTKLGKAVFGLQDLEFGDPVFDPKVRVKTSDPAQAKQRLDIDSRRAFVALIDAHPAAVAERASVQWSRQGISLDETETRSVLKGLVGFAARLGR